MRPVSTFTLVAAILLANIGASAQEAAPQPALPRTVKLNRFVPSGEPRSINFLTALFPDCSSRGTVVGRIVTAPTNGTLSFEQTTSFPSYPPTSPLAACNNRKVPGVSIVYASKEGYTGEDQARIFMIFPDGSGGEWEITFIVK